MPLTGAPIRIIRSQNKRQLVVVNNQKYRLVSTKCNVLKWRCSTDKKCTAFVLCKPDMKTVLQCQGQHKHELKGTKDKVDAQDLRERSKRAIHLLDEYSPSRVIDIVSAEMKSSDPTMALDVRKCRSGVRKAMNEDRQKTIGPKPAHVSLHKIRIDLGLSGHPFEIRGLRFVHAPANADFACATTSWHLRYIRQHCTELFAMMMHGPAPKHFECLYTVYGMPTDANGHMYVPLACFVLVYWNHETVASAWQFLKHLLDEQQAAETGPPFDFRYLHVDFWSTMHDAVTVHFPGVVVQNHIFDVRPLWMPKIKSNKILSKAFADPKDPLGQWLHELFNLPLLPSSCVSDAFADLFSVCPSKEAEKFSDFLVDEFIMENCVYPPDIWASNAAPNKRIKSGPDFPNIKKKRPHTLKNFLLNVMNGIFLSKLV